MRLLVLIILTNVHCSTAENADTVSTIYVAIDLPKFICCRSNSINGEKDTILSRRNLYCSGWSLKNLWLLRWAFKILVSVDLLKQFLHFMRSCMPLMTDVLATISIYCPKLDVGCRFCLQIKRLLPDFLSVCPSCWVSLPSTPCKMSNESLMLGDDINAELPILVKQKEILYFGSFCRLLLSARSLSARMHCKLQSVICSLFTSTCSHRTVLQAV